MISNATKAVFRREWAAYFNSPVAYVFIIIWLVMAGFFAWAVGRLFESGQAELRGFFFWPPWLFLILVPAAAMGLWSEERRSHTIELLFTQPITISQAVWGKYLAAWAFLSLNILLTFPTVLSVRYLGDPDMGVVFTGYLGCILLAGSYLALGMWTSALTKSQVISFILALVIGLFLILAGFPPVTSFLSGFCPTWLVDGIAAFSFMGHYENLQRGIIDLRDLVYFASVIGVMIAATQITLRQKAGA